MQRLSIFIATIFLFATAAAAQLRGPTNQILIPAAGAVGGANGTFFRSDITLTNFRDVDQRVQLRWLPQSSGTPGTLPPLNTVTITIPAHSGITSEDFVTNYLNVTGLGAILITGVTSTDSVDPAALLFATARIWSPQPGSSGTVSQTFPVLPTGALNAAPQTLILGLHDDSRYRANVGIVNLDPVNARTFDIYQNTDNPSPQLLQSTVTVGPMAMQQIALVPNVSKVLQVTVVPRTGTDPHLWAAYGSSIDNVTGDSWSNLAMPLLNGQ